MGRVLREGEILHYQGATPQDLGPSHACFRPLGPISVHILIALPGRLRELSRPGICAHDPSVDLLPTATLCPGIDAAIHHRVRAGNVWAAGLRSTSREFLVSAVGSAAGEPIVNFLALGAPGKYIGWIADYEDTVCFQALKPQMVTVTIEARSSTGSGGTGLHLAMLKTSETRREDKVHLARRESHEERGFELWQLGTLVGIVWTLVATGATWYGMSQALGEEHRLIAQVGKKPLDPSFDFGPGGYVWPVAVLVVFGLLLFAHSACTGRSTGRIAGLALALVSSAVLAWQIWSAGRQINSCDYHESCVLVLGNAQSAVTAAEVLAVFLFTGLLFVVPHQLLQLAEQRNRR